MSADAGGDDAAVAEARVGVNAVAAAVVVVVVAVVVAVEASVVAVAGVGCPTRTIARMWKTLAFELGLYDD